MNVSKLKITVKNAIAPTIVVTLIFFMTYFIFGPENSMIGPFATLSFLRYRTMRNHYQCMVKNYVIFMAMAILSYFAVMNLGLCILINSLALFWIADILIDEYHPNNYFPAGMALIFFQIAPVDSPMALLNRVEALAATFLIVFVFVFILSKINRKADLLSQFIKEGFSVSREILGLCNNYEKFKEINSGESAHDDRKQTVMNKLNECHHRLCEINQQISQEIYSYNRSILIPKGKTNWYCHFVLVFQVINYLTLKPEIEENVKMASQIYDSFLHEFETVSPSGDYHRLNFRVHRPDFRSFRLRFALRQVITVMPCLVFAWVSEIPNVYWLVISVFFMMIPFTDHTMQRVRERVTGTIAGILICLVLFSIFPGFAARVVIMTVANFFIYGTSSYGPTVAYITCSALAMQTMDSIVTPVLMQRLLYTLIGAGIALLANRLIFPIRIKRQVDYLIELLERIPSDLRELDRNTIPGDDRRRCEIDQYIIKSYLLTDRLKGLLEALPKEEVNCDYETIQKEHMTFMAEYLYSYLITEPAKNGH